MRVGGVFRWRARLISQLSATFSSTLARRQADSFPSTNINERARNMFKPSSSSSTQTSDKLMIEFPRFQYKALDLARNEIRLLRITPNSNPDSTIQCQIFHTSLDKAPPYEALSYTWGDRSGLHKIVIDSSYVNVTPNLDHALRRLRPKPGDSELVIWVDALCINQEDITERSIQTSKMRVIYQVADKVSIWLGMENNESALAIQLARDLNRSSMGQISRMIRDPARENQFSALVVLFRRQYWWRIWVIQEVSCARTATVYCGGDSIPWTQLENVCDILKEQNEPLQRLYYKSLSYIRTLTHAGPKGLQLSRYSPDASAPPLLELLLSHKSKKSTDPRDKVYALVGISDTRHSFGPINYSLTVREIFTHTTRHIISSSRKLDVICVKQRDKSRKNMPTWAPDWTRPSEKSGHMVIGLHHREPTFAAAGGSLAQCSYSHDGYVLRASGFTVDRISAIGMSFKKQGSPSDVMPSLQVFHNWWNIFVEFMGNSLSAQAAFARIISCGTWVLNNEEMYQDRLKGIFALSKNQLIRYHTSEGESKEEADGFELSKTETDEDEKAQMASILSASLTMNRRRLFIGTSSSNRVAGLAPWDAESGDKICIFLGCRFPVVLRRQGDYHVLIGEAYVEGMMDGQAIRSLRDGLFVQEDFEIH